MENNFKGTYVFARNINKTGASGIINVEDNTVFCLCKESESAIMLEFIAFRQLINCDPLELLERFKAMEKALGKMVEETESYCPENLYDKSYLSDARWEAEECLRTKTVVE